jgi:hypothetical protein
MTTGIGLRFWPRVELVVLNERASISSGSWS